jgi:hypothetical protein
MSGINKTQLRNREEHMYELRWMDENIFVHGKRSEILVTEVESQFMSQLYLGEGHYARVRRMLNGEEGSLSLDDYARACCSQQILELLVCVLVQGRGNFPEDLLYESGVSKFRLIGSQYGHYFEQWCQKLGQDRVVAKQAEELRLMKERIEEQERALETAKTVREGLMMMHQMQNVLVAEPTPRDLDQFMEQDFYAVAMREDENELGDLVRGSIKSILVEEDQGVEMMIGEGREDQMNKGSLATFVRGSLYLQPFQNHLYTVDPRAPVVNLDIQKFEKSVPVMVGPIEKSLCQSGLVHYNLNARIIPDQLNLLVDSLEQMNMLAVDLTDQNQKGLTKKSSHCKYTINLHGMTIGRGRSVIIAVSWKGTQCDRVDRVAISDPNGINLMDEQCKSSLYGKQYSEWFFKVRKQAYVIMVGADIYGFNVHQHLSRLGFGGKRQLIMDMSMAPELKGKGSPQTIENYQIRYGRTRDELIQREDPFYSNLIYCVCLVRRFGFRWKHRRRKNDLIG